MSDNPAKTFTGVVVSTKMQKTITVSIEHTVIDRLYGKKVIKSKNFHAHDEEEVASLGDVVVIQETRPLSKTKKFILVKVVTKAKR
jgi:small subunit ribosomal protein S17